MILVALDLVSHSCSKPNEKQLKVYVLDGGAIHVPNAAVLGLDTFPTILSNNIYLIDHPKGFLLWDTGLPDHFKDSINGVTNPLATEVVTKTVRAQFDELGLQPSDIDYVALSHAHSDHAGNLPLFPNATLLIQQQEYQLALSDQAAQNFIDPKPFRNHQKVKEISGRDYDVFGDSTVVLKFTPGHSVGHQSLFLSLANYGNVVISGDIYHHPLNRTTKKFPFFNFSHERTNQQAEKIEEFIQEQKAALWIQHSPRHDSITYSPSYYD